MPSICRTTRHPGYEISQRIRKRVEEIFGWLKTIGLMRKLHHRGTDRVDWMFVFACAIYNLVRIRNLQAGTRMRTPHLGAMARSHGARGTRASSSAELQLA